VKTQILLNVIVALNVSKSKFLPLMVVDNSCWQSLIGVLCADGCPWNYHKAFQ